MKDFYAALGASLKVPTPGRAKSKAAQQETAPATASAPAFKVETVGATRSVAGQVSDELLKGGEAKTERAKANLPRVDGPLPAPSTTVTPLTSMSHADGGLKSVEATSSEALIITATNTDTEEDEPPEQQVFPHRLTVCQLALARLRLLTHSYRAGCRS